MNKPDMPQFSAIFPAIALRQDETPVGYEAAVAWMEQRAAQIRDGSESECIWLLEHPAIYTAGTSAQLEDLIEPDRFPVHRTGRGGQFTYHGPGQRIAYVMLDLAARGKDVRAFVCKLEDWLISTLAAFGVKGERRTGRVGVWVVRKDLPVPREDKIAAVGVRVRRWVTFHGVSLNVTPDLTHYDGIIPCGVQDHGVTSLKELGVDASLSDVDAVLKEKFEQTFQTELTACVEF